MENNVEQISEFIKLQQGKIDEEVKKERDNLKYRLDMLVEKLPPQMQKRVNREVIDIVFGG